MTLLSRHPFVLSIALTSPGFAFVLFEGPQSPFDWGMKTFRRGNKNTEIVRAVAALISRYAPDTLVLSDATDPDAKRCARIRSLTRSLVRLAENESIEVFLASRLQVKECFAYAGAKTKYDIAMAVARLLPALAPKIPKVRKCWMSEDARQNVFDAAANGLTYYRAQSRTSLPNVA